MTHTAQLLDTVALLRDLPQHGVMRGDVGTIVEVYDDAYEVEFVGENGTPRAMFAVPQEDCLPVHLGGAARAITGVVEGALWYWYDPDEDVLDARLTSKRSVAAQPEPAPEGFTLMRDPATGAAVGMVIRGFWSRFGSGDRPDREMLEQRVSGLAAKFAA